MKKSILLSLCAVSLLAAEEAKKAQDVVVVDLGKVVNVERPEESLSAEWKDTFGKLKTELMSHRSKIENKQREYQQNYGGLDMSKLTDEQRESLIRMENEVRLETQLYQSAEAKLSAFQAEFFKKLTDASEKVLKSTGAKVVLQGPVLAAAPEVDVTQALAKELNAKYQTEQRAKKLTKLPETPVKK